jgi:hypothetical protein
VDTTGGAQTRQEAEVVQVSAWLPRGLVRSVEALAIDALSTVSETVEELLLEALVRRAGLR